MNKDALALCIGAGVVLATETVVIILCGLKYLGVL